MTKEQLAVILALPNVNDQISKLSISSFDIPEWSGLVKEYDPKQHQIRTNLLRYPYIRNKATGADDMKRIVRGMQATLCDRIGQAMFVTPVERKYSYDRDNQTQKDAIDIIEQAYRTDNNIDSENIERGKMNNASCQVATVWYTTEEESTIKGLKSKYTLKHMSYSEMDGYEIFPIADNYNNLLAISFKYTDSEETTTYFDTYTNTDKPTFRRFTSGADGWALSDESKEISVFPVVYTHLKQPVWGEGTVLVEEIEEVLSYRSMYIKKNAVPFATIDYGDLTGKSNNTETKESDEDKRRLLELGKGGKVEFPVWDMNNGTVDQHIKAMTDAFYDDNQSANMSFSNMMGSATSADNKEIMLSDPKARAIDLGGEWQKLYNYEVNKIVIPILKIMFPSLANTLDLITARSIIKPYMIRSDKEKAEFVANAGGSMSLSTKVRELGKVDDIEAEVEKIEEEAGAQANQL